MARLLPIVLTIAFIVTLEIFFSFSKSDTTSKIVPQSLAQRKCLKQNQNSRTSSICAYCLNINSIEGGNRQKATNIQVKVTKVIDSLTTQDSLLLVRRPANLFCQEYLQFVDQTKLTSLQNGNTVQKADIIPLENSGSVQSLLQILNTTYQQNAQSNVKNHFYNIPNDVGQFIVYQFTQGANVVLPEGQDIQVTYSGSSQQSNFATFKTILTISLFLYFFTLFLICKCKEDNPRVSDRNGCGQVPVVDCLADDISIQTKLFLLLLYLILFLRLYVDLHSIDNADFVLSSTSYNIFMTVCLLKLYKSSSHSFIKATAVGLFYGGIILLQSLTLFKESSYKDWNLEFIFWVIFGFGYLLIYKKCMSDEFLQNEVQVINYFIFISLLKMVTQYNYETAESHNSASVLGFLTLCLCSYFMVFWVGEIPDQKVEKFVEFNHGKGISLKGYENQLEEMQY